MDKTTYISSFSLMLLFGAQVVLSDSLSVNKIRVSVTEPYTITGSIDPPEEDTHSGDRFYRDRCHFMEKRNSSVWTWNGGFGGDNGEASLPDPTWIQGEYRSYDFEVNGKVESQTFSQAIPGDYYYRIYCLGEYSYEESEDGSSSETIYGNDSVVSSLVVKVTVGDVNPPTRVDAPTFNSNGSVTVTWPHVAYATSYPFLYSFNGGTLKAVEGYDVNSLVRTHTFNDLVDGVYRFYVGRCTTTYCGKYQLNGFTTVEHTPTPPETVTVPTYSSESTSSVQWTRSTGNNVRYELQRRELGGEWGPKITTTDLSYPIDGLAHGKSYQFRVTACNATCAAPVEGATMEVVYKPLIPTLEVAPAVSLDGKYTFTWNRPSFATTFELFDSLNTDVPVYKGSDLSKELTNTNGNYSYYIRACNSKGTCSDPSPLVSVTINRDVNIPILTIDTENSASGELILNWTKIVKGELAVQYQILNDMDKTVYSGTDQSTRIENLTDGRHCYRIQAVTVSDQSGYSAEACATVAILHAPDAAPVLRAPASTGSNYEITWKAVDRADRYELQQRINDNGWKTVPTEELLQYTYSTFPIELGNHSYKIRAGNAAGWSEYGSEITVVAELDPTAQIRKQLYYNEADRVSAEEENATLGIYSRENAAFRYIDLMYDLDPSSKKVTNRFASGDVTIDFTTLYSSTERRRSIDVQNYINEQLAAYPDNSNLQRFLLDVYHDRAVAEIILANIELDKARISRLRNEDIRTEVTLIDNAFDIFSDALDQYDTLLVNQSSILVDYAASRGQISPRYRDENDVAQPVINDEQLFTGYKDIVMLYQLMIKMAETKAKQAQLLVIAGQTNQTLLDEMKEELMTLKARLSEKEQALIALFPATDFTTVLGFSGLPSAVHRLDAELRELDQAIAWMSGDSNILGLPDDAVLLVQGYGLDGNTTFDSFDAMKQHIDPVSGGPLALAISSENKAKSSFDTFRYNSDKLATEFTDRNRQYTDRLADLAGLSCNAISCESESDEATAGSQLSLQKSNIESAKIALDRNLARMENLLRAIEIEIERRAVEEEIQDGISKVILKYGEKQAYIVDQIKEVRKKAAKARKRNALVNTVVAAVATVATGGAAAPLVMATAAASAADTLRSSKTEITQINSEGKLQKLSQQLAAEERAELAASNNKLLDLQSKAKVKSMWLEANTIALDIAQTEVTVDQEIERSLGMLNQIERMITQLNETNANFVNRYFADPIHGSRLSADMIQAEKYFNVAQRWLFFSVNALEYKWQQRFIAPVSKERKEDIYRLRDASDLQRFYSEMVEFDKFLNLSNTSQATDVFSIKDDVFGYVEKIGDVIQEYPHPDPEQDVGQRLSAVNAFRERLKLLKRKLGPDTWITLDFSTVKDIPPTFFSGPILDDSGDISCLADGGTYLDKIETVQLNVPIEYTLSGLRTIPAFLTYGGTNYVRNRTPGTVTSDGFGIKNEFMTYSTRVWDASNQNTLSFKDSYRQKMSANLSEHDEARTDSITTAFKERSVATTGWRLSLQLVNIEETLVNIDQINDVELIFRHRFKSRNFSNCTSGGGPLDHDDEVE